MTKIGNKSQLIGNGEGRLNRKARSLAIRCLESALNAVDPSRLMTSRLSLKRSLLKVDGYSFDLKRHKNIFVIGGGKASGSMAEALNRILGGSITDGLVNVPYGSKHETGVIRCHEASHPIPDKSGVEGTRRMLDIVEAAGKDDLIICLISGGGSSLMPLPRDGVSLLDKRKITEALLKSGARIDEINTLRKHVSDFKGGWLAKKAYPTPILNLILSDVVCDPLSFIASGPTVPDMTTFGDAIKILRKYGLWEEAPESIRRLLIDGNRGVAQETPKENDHVFREVYNVVIGNNRSASLAACKQSELLHLNSLLLTATLEGEARHVGIVLTSIAYEITKSNNPIPKPATVIAGGETTVTVIGNGVGGRNQEIVLAGVPRLSSMKGVAVASLSTDGVDGPTDAAGAIADGMTLARAAKTGLTPEEHLARNDSYSFFSKLDDLIHTGATGTNVNDITVAVVI